MSSRSQAEILHRLVAGVPADMILAEREQTGLPVDDVLADVNAIHLERRRTSVSREISRAHAYWIAGIRRRLAAIAETGLDTVDGIGAAEFYDGYYAGNRPLLIRNASHPRPWTAAWDFERLRASFGDTAVEVQRWPSWEFLLEHRDLPGSCEELTLERYLDEILRPDAPPSYLTSLNGAHRGKLRAFTESLVLLPETLPPSANSNEAYIFIGPRGAVSHLHYDTGNVMIVQVAGVKRFLLAAPHEHGLLYEGGFRSSTVDARRPDLERFPLYRFARLHEALLQPGQALFIPVGWWHFVESLEPSVSVSVTTFRHPNSYPDDTF